MKENWSDDELLNILKDYYIKNNKIPKQQEIKPMNGLPSFSVYYKRFGNLKNILNELNISTDDDKFNRKHYTDQELLNLLNEETVNHLENNIYLISEREFDLHEQLPHSSIYQRRFGGIKNAYNLIGYNFDQFNNQALEHNMIIKFKLLAKELGHTPNSREIDKYSKLNKCYATKTYAEHFGSIYKLQVLCAMIPTKMGINRTPEEMLLDLKKLGQYINDIPTADDIDACEFTCCSLQYLKIFGGMENSLLLAGFPKDKIKKKWILTKGKTKCLSKYEYRIATILEENSFQFDKDTYYKDVIYNFNKKYKFDFIVYYKNKINYIEIFGIQDNETYYTKAKEKISICKENNIPLICLYPKDFWSISNLNLLQLLINKINSNMYYEFSDDYFKKEVVING